MGKVDIKKGITGNEIFGYPKNLGLKLPKVSIIVTNYNYGRYIVDCLVSIVNQTYANWECIIVDDCSKDDSIAIITNFIHLHKEYESSFTLTRTSVNSGQMEAIRVGLLRSNGEFVMSIDADDMLYSNFIETHISYHLNAEIPFAFTCSNQIQIDEKNNIIAGNYNRFIDLKNVKKSLPVEIFGTWEWTALGAAVFRKPILDLILPVDNCNMFRICVDFYFFYFANLLGGSIIIPDFLGCYRRHSNNNFSSNKIITGLAFSGDMRNDPDKELSRKIMLNQVDKKFGSFMAHFSDEGLSRIVYQLVIQSAAFYELKKGYPQLLKYFPADKSQMHHRIEHEKEFLYKIYYSIFGRIAYKILKTAIIFKERVVVFLFPGYAEVKKR